MQEPAPHVVQRTVFTYVHALAFFFHFAWPYLYTDAPWVHTGTGLVALVALCVALWRPDDLRALIVLFVVQLVDVALLMPVVPNHWLLTAVVDLCLLLSFVATRGASDTLARVREPLAWGIGIFYFYTGFWKLTEEWFDPAVSCGAHAWHRLAAQFSLPVDGPGVTTAIYATLVIELLGPIGLVWRRTRGVVVALFVAFHLVLGLDVAQNFMNFSTVMMSLLVLTLDADAFGRIAGWVPRIRMLGRGWVVLIVALQVLALQPAAYTAFALLRWLPWVVHALLIVAWFAWLAPAPVPRRAALGVAWLLPVLVVANGAAPIVGLKTRNSWQMYSNLRLEADTSNHLLLPRSLDLLGHLAQPVTVESVSVPALQREWDPPVQLTWFTLHNTLEAHPDASVTYQREGQRFVVDRAGSDPTLQVRSPAWQRWFVWYRPLGPEVADQCQW